MFDRAYAIIICSIKHAVIEKQGCDFLTGKAEIALERADDLLEYLTGRWKIQAHLACDHDGDIFYTFPLTITADDIDQIHYIKVL